MSLNPRTARLIAEARDLSLHYGMRALPTPACSALGAWFGIRLGQRGHPAADARARALLRRLRPDLATDPVALEDSIQTLWRHVGRTYAEFAAIERIAEEGRTIVNGSDHLNNAYADDRPLILCFFHLGNWEVLGQQIARHPLINQGRPFSALVMPPANRAHALIAARRRASLPVNLIPMGRNVWHTVAETLRKPRGIVWLAGDEVVNGQVSAPHFGRPPRTDGNLGKMVRLAAATGARILPIYNERIGPSRFCSHILPILDMPRGRLTPADIQAEVMRIDALFEPIVRRLITQWYMAIEFGGDTEPARSPAPDLKST
ncbi:MAG TPA: lysophospholipid acyltransferase family protein [Rhodopila sp.]|nr:lysophospholipid acyltransferase family protein [Rhodopila sp.]